MNSPVLFQVGDVSVSLPSFIITDDIIPMETDEIYQLGFSSSTPSHNVILGNSTTITINDDDGELN